MKCFFALALVGLLALAAADDDSSYEIIETRESCTPPAKAAGACRREIIKREDCHVVGGVQYCNRIEDGDHEIRTVREGCRIVGPQKICTREVLKREDCRPTRHGGDRCDSKRTELEDCRPSPTGGDGCGRGKRALLDAEERAAVMDGKIHFDEYEEVVMRELCRDPRHGVCKREIMDRKVCRRFVGGVRCIDKRVEEDNDIIVTRETCTPPAKAAGACKREVIKSERCRECRALE